MDIHNSLKDIENGVSTTLQTTDDWQHALEAVKRWIMTQQDLRTGQRRDYVQALDGLMGRLEHVTSGNPAKAWLNSMRDDSQLLADVEKLQAVCNLISDARGRETENAIAA
jgi:hypothetical protein